jgi:hypothetical protein
MRQLLLALALALAACGSTKSSAPSPNTPATAPTDSAPAPSASTKQIKITFGPRTDVMDSPSGQLSKAKAALAASDLVAQLKALGYEVDLDGDQMAPGNSVVVTAGADELGRGELRDLEHAGDAASKIVDAAKARKP